MARSRRNLASDPAATFAAHAVEARQHRVAALAAGHGSVATQFDYAAAHHDTAARLLGHAQRASARAATYRSVAGMARARRELGVAKQYDEWADAQDAAAAFATQRASGRHEAGLARSGVGHQAREAILAAQVEDDPVQEVPAAIPDWIGPGPADRPTRQTRPASN